MRWGDTEETRRLSIGEGGGRDSEETRRLSLGEGGGSGETRRLSRGEGGGRDSGRPGDYIMEGVDKLYAGRGHNACHWPGIIIILYCTVYRL